MKMERNEQLREAWEFVENTGTSIFLTGKAGTGKTTFLKTVVEKSKKRLIVVAPTGVAAINAGGVTIHSFFQLPLSPFVPGTQTKNKFDFGKEKRKIIASLDLLIIDEISMVRADLLDAIDNVLRRYKDRYQPFGGVQLLMIGDLQQLTPVVTPEDEIILKPYYDTPYFFGSKALKQISYVTIQLKTVYRQQDNLFISILNHIRKGQPTADDIQLLNQRYNPTFIPKAEDGYIRLTTHNNAANGYNNCELQRLSSESFSFNAQIEGNFPEYSYPTSPILTVKQGAQVMFIKNDPLGRYYNGRIGHVVSVDSDHIVVKCPDDSQNINVEPLEWENTHYKLNVETKEIESEVQGTFKQFPLKLAWAITIHKSQGLTFSHAIIDAVHSFAPGQVYVALSRCTSLEGLVLASPITPQAIINDEKVDNYILQQEVEAQKSIAQLPALKEEYFRYLLLELFNFQTILFKEEYMVRLMAEFFYRSHTKIAELHKQTLANTKQNVLEVSYKWSKLIRQLPHEQMHEPDFLSRVSRGASYFEQTIESIYAKPLTLTADVKTNNKQAMARLTDALLELKQAVHSHKNLLKKIAERGFSVSIYLKEKNLSLLESLEDGKKSKRTKTNKQTTTKVPKAPKESTYSITFRLFSQGLTPKEIAIERCMAVSTIYSHLQKFIDSNKISIQQVIEPERIRTTQRIIQMVGKDEGITAIKALCPPDISYEEIRMVISVMK